MNQHVNCLGELRAEVHFGKPGGDVAHYRPRNLIV